MRLRIGLGYRDVTGVVARTAQTGSGGGPSRGGPSRGGPKSLVTGTDQGQNRRAGCMCALVYVSAWLYVSSVSRCRGLPQNPDEAETEK